MRRLALAVLLAWTLTVDGTVYDAARDEWVIRFTVADDQGRMVTQESVQISASVGVQAVPGRLRAVLEAVRARQLGPLPPGFTVTSP
jgi:hypothetical protein